MYIGADSGRIYKSINAGSNWGLLSSLPAIHTVRSILIHPNDHNVFFAATFGEGIFVSTDSGGHWSQFNSGLSDLQIYSLESDNASPLNLYAGSRMSGVFHNTYTVVTHTPAARIDLPKQFSLEQSYPNPFNPSTTITYSLPADGIVSLQIYNILGQRVTVLVDGLRQAGRKSVEWNADNVPSGVYYYVLDVYDPASYELKFQGIGKTILLR